ncbi:LysR family transcriptional regulator [Aliiroseovarius sp. KMU-50]|uniref:LysR family transcriptional regulator n=1 Tax=Aliiroseovarius salicola TaxID=3009082 RepID=A0ABT4W682_9RHOB|nr:LysR family transcriptional regulator [Aliiroseovarius sp. KMU-50]MDA5095313.1 LysR family transcriptional regulator [Aliiroseovarius sp. KMU-50]
MDVRWLEDFLALAELKNFTRAAEFRNVSQAAFSRRIQSLEHWLGTPLVVKGAVPVRLTEAGEQFLDSARIAVDRLLDARASIRTSQFDVMSQVRIAMPNVLARSEFRRVLSIIERKHNSSFSVIVGTTNDVVARYLAGDADILFAHDCPAIPTHDTLDQHERLVIRRDLFQPYATRDEAKREAFGFPGTPRAPFPMVSYSQKAYFARLYEHVQERARAGGAALPHKISVQCDMSDVLKEVIAAGYGIGWLPESAVDDTADAQIAPIGGPEWALEVDICAFHPPKPSTPSIEAIWASLKRRAVPDGF